jgi:hypothetical protein
MKKKRLFNRLPSLLFVGLLLVCCVSTNAGPPPNAKKLMIPFPVICTPTMAEMMTALVTDYAVHISMTFEESPITGVVVLHNPDTKTAAVLHIMEGRICLVFSGLNLLLFDRPEGMAPPKEKAQTEL